MHVFFGLNVCFQDNQSVEIYCVLVQGQHLQDGIIPWWGE
jgi:hypothetical protein